MPKHFDRAKSAEPQEQEWSLKWVALALMGLIAALCWSLAAASYLHNELGWRSGGVDAAARGDTEVGGRRGRRALSDFFANAFKQLPNAPQVIGHTFARAWWVLILFGVLETLAGLFWLKASRLEREFVSEEKRRGG